MESIAEQQGQDVLRTLPGDDVRQIMWRFADRYDLQMLVQSARAVARGPVARLVAEGARNTHEWTAAEGRAPEGLRRVRASRRSSWTRSRAASSRARRTWRWRWSPSSWPGWTRARPPAAWRATSRLAPIHERGTPEQRDTTCAAPSRPSPARTARSGAAPSPHRADPLRRRRDRPARRQGARGRVGGGRGADPPGGQARPLHHQHGLRQLRHRRRGLRRPAHQGQLHGHPGGDRPGHLRPRRAHARSWSTSSPRPAIRSSACACPPAASSAATRSRTASSSPTTATARSSRRSSAARA